MSSRPDTYIEITVDDGYAHVAPDCLDWSDEQTARFNFEKPNLTPDDHLVIGYLTMEENGMFADLSLDEQQQIARRLKR
jgi:hypothetical protein